MSLLSAAFESACQHLGVDIIPSGPDEPSDFELPGRNPVHVVLIEEPHDRQVEIGALRSHGARLLIIDEHDVTDLLQVPGGASAGFLFENWLHHGTHGSAGGRR